MHTLTSDKPMSERSSRLVEIAGIALTLTVAFHFLLGSHPFGFGFAAFIVILAACMALVAALGKRSINMWAFIFLIPAVFSAVSHAFFANEVSQSLGFVLGLGSLALFAFWLTRPLVSFKHVTSLWPLAFWLETIWPFEAMGNFYKAVKLDSRLKSVILGVAISIPFLLIFLGLFTAADQLFAKSFGDLFSNVSIGENLYKIIRDVIVGLFFLSGGLVMYKRMHKHVEERKELKEMDLNSVALITFLVMLNILFAVFVIFQAAYYFGGEGFITAQGITFADYARHGFFELLFAAGLVFGIIWFIYWATGMKNRIVGILNVVMVALTGIIIASAISRLLLYVDTYGLTRARWWAMACIILIGLTLFAAAFGAMVRLSYQSMAKTIFIVALMFGSLLLVIRSDAFIARYNVNRYLSGKTDAIDLSYLVNHLSYDAVPALIDLYDSAGDKIYIAHKGDSEWERSWTKESFAAALRDKKRNLQDRMQNAWLGMSASHLHALSALDRIE